ncbi:helix-turn-helix transcriptional regulator [Parvularcula flava]|uniref:Transcriptional regulator n=1 Tax=Aquisalinus luteolus TaxID=1566827 RepID=A0A8J3A019_9PROT|nr:helix-turn-helix transcriptional regulator [Aquisalinus luteolus]NHK26386.1 helix-turn-helix transcriptional regulator [Aquisalinus luteolus]GGH92178.1 transcriptional regulator [Aquisalinus luteolus]
MHRPNPIDKLVGENLRTMRTMRGLSQQEMGDRVDLTFQQIQKYEKGSNRIAASRLWAFCEILDVPLDAFYMPSPAEAIKKGAEGNPHKISDRQEADELPPVTSADIRLAARINALPADARTKLRDLIDVLYSQRK